MNDSLTGWKPTQLADALRNIGDEVEDNYDGLLLYDAAKLLETLIDPQEVARLARGMPCIRWVRGYSPCSVTPTLGLCPTCKTSRDLLRLAGESE